jgi:leucyl aminopeptidase
VHQAGINQASQQNYNRRHFTPMNIEFSAQPIAASTLGFAISKGGLDASAEHLPAPISAMLRGSAAAARFDGSAGSLFETYAELDGTLVRILLMGLGDGSAADAEKAGGAITARLQISGVTHLAADMRSAPSADAAAAAHFAMGALLRNWRIDSYRTKLTDNQKPSLNDITIISGAADAAKTRFADLKAVADGVALTRELVAEPANIIYPETFVDRCQHLSELGIEIDVLDETAMKALGMGALLGVAQGSVRPPRLLVMRWNGLGDSAGKPVVLVGKGVTFDTGGISLKPGPGMEDMKWDMGGAGAVVGAMKALATRKAKAHVVGVCGLVENMPDGNAQRPGDIVTTMSGQTVEVLNTDAEGRLVLCDAITWVQKTYAPDVIVDLATLTGAIILSLGHEYGGLFANDDGLAAQLDTAGAAVGERLWRMPMGDVYNKMIDSPIADIKNIGPREAGSITAAQFIKRFVDDGVKWAHLDIAGMVWSAKDAPTYAKGATGYGVRLLDRFIADNYEIA